MLLGEIHPTSQPWLLGSTCLAPLYSLSPALLPRFHHSPSLPAPPGSIFISPAFTIKRGNESPSTEDGRRESRKKRVRQPAHNTGSCGFGFGEFIEQKVARNYNMQHLT